MPFVRCSLIRRGKRICRQCPVPGADGYRAMFEAANHRMGILLPVMIWKIFLLALMCAADIMTGIWLPLLIILQKSYGTGARTVECE